MSESRTEKVLALFQEVESELFDVALINDEEYDTVERVFAEVATQPIVEKDFEHQGEEEVSDKQHWDLVVEEIKIVGKETNPVAVTTQEEISGIDLLPVQGIKQIVIAIVDVLADRIGVVAALKKVLREVALFELESVDVGQQDVGIVAELVVVEVVELQTVESNQEIHEG
jgi:hypothetical protein